MKIAGARVIKHFKGYDIIISKSFIISQSFDGGLFIGECANYVLEIKITGGLI